MQPPIIKDPHGHDLEFNAWMVTAAVVVAMLTLVVTVVYKYFIV